MNAAGRTLLDEDNCSCNWFKNKLCITSALSDVVFKAMAFHLITLLEHKVRFVLF